MRRCGRFTRVSSRLSVENSAHIRSSERPMYEWLLVSFAHNRSPPGIYDHARIASLHEGES
jgi:hypothetical protein